MMKIPNEQELQQFASNHSFDRVYDDFMKIYKQCTTKLYSFLINGTTLLSNNSLRFRKNLAK